MTATTNRYHPLWVLAHWLTAVLMLISLAGGILALRHIPNTDPRKASMIAVHAIGGLMIGVLLLARLVMRATTRKPQPADTASVWANRLRKVVHALLYVVGLSMVVTGLGTLRSANSFPAVFGAGGALPRDFWEYPVRQGHMVYSRVLIALIALHLAAAAYRQFVRHDGVFGRMWIGRRIGTMRDAGVEGSPGCGRGR